MICFKSYFYSYDENGLLKIKTDKGRAFRKLL